METLTGYLHKYKFFKNSIWKAIFQYELTIFKTFSHYKAVTTLTKEVMRNVH